MNEILKNVFLESGYSLETIRDGFEYYSLSNKAYFFLLELDQAELENLKNYSEFDLIADYDKIKGQYQTLVKAGISNTIEKNSSLIITVKCNSLESIESLKQQILMIEEDEYYFKKYVIIYSEDSILEIKTSKPLLELFAKKLVEEDKFDVYANSGITNDISEYLVILQFYIKLPFLKLSFTRHDYESLENKIKEKLGPIMYKTYDLIIENSQRIEELNFNDRQNDAIINDILATLKNA